MKASKPLIGKCHDAEYIVQKYLKAMKATATSLLSPTQIQNLLPKLPQDNP
jgi:hypothetical protein